MPLSSKEILIIVTGLFITISISVILPIFNKINFKDIRTIYLFLVIEFITILLILVIMQKRINENVDDIEKNKKGVEELNKRFKTIEELNDIRLNIRELQKEVFKNGEKK